MAEVVCRGLVDWTATTEPATATPNASHELWMDAYPAEFASGAGCRFETTGTAFEQLADLLLRFISSRPRLTGLADGAVWHDGHVDLRAGAHVCRELFIPNSELGILNDQVVHMRRTQLGAAHRIATNRHIGCFVVRAYVTGHLDDLLWISSQDLSRPQRLSQWRRDRTNRCQL